ncbi:TetR/AcrR family transcriptional regulator [Actinomadura atramentaria]|uniref:TetR/AcrR family transcriptional regulator n=1 Tax=Actinomadura atramentaria TaxID=1990 RepID=UPI000375029E|nr:TetR/AcrR family transcriptional regulator [Actinomadura atramentaria]
MRSNPERRAALVDAAIEVLAGQGARGLTFRSVDQRAGVPAGTASNYFASRDDLLTQAGARVYERLVPDEGVLERNRAGTTAEDFLAGVRETVARVTAFPTGHLALLELRLEATRNPALRAVLTERIRADMDFNVAHHRASGLPGDDVAVRLVQLAIGALITEQLTLPDLVPDEERDVLVTEAVRRLVGDG